MTKEIDFTVRSRAIEKLKRDMSTDILLALENSQTLEIMLNSDGKVWSEQFGQPIKLIGTLSVYRAESIIKTIAGFHNKEITRFNPIIEGELPLDGSRFAGQLPPVVIAPTFAIRKKASEVFTLSYYIEKEVMSEEQHRLIQKVIQKHCNILVIGGTGSGKTTLVNAIIHEMTTQSPMERLVIIEDTGEIQCRAENYIQYHTTPEISLTQLLKTTLRMRPDRILVGEVRGEEALDLLDAWNTGHEGGVATLHANNVHSALQRLKSLVTRNRFAPTQIESLIGEVVHCIIHIAKTPQGRRIQEIITIEGSENQQYQITHH